MDFAPNPTQALVLWKLLFTGEQPALSKVQPKLEPSDRLELVQAGLVQLEKRGRSQHIVPTDKAWDWAQAHLDAPLMKSAVAAIVLQRLLARLKSYLDVRDLALADLFVDEPDAPPANGEPVARRIREAYLQESGGNLSVRVRLAALRQRLGATPRDAVDSALVDMQRAGDLVLMTLDNPAERQPADDDAAFDVVGEKRHIAYLVR